MIEAMSLDLPKLHCYKCGHDWIPRSPRRPALCPNCNFARFDDPSAVPSPIFPVNVAGGDSTIDTPRLNQNVVESTTGNRKWELLLREILESGDSVFIRAIQSNLLAFSRAVGLSRERALSGSSATAISDKDLARLHHDLEKALGPRGDQGESPESHRGHPSRGRPAKKRVS